MKKLSFAFLLLLAGIGSAFATPTTLNATVNVDNVFEAYISTSASTLGTLIGSDNSNWSDLTTFSSLLTPGVTNYLHVVATNEGGQAAFWASSL
jgi:hypothetical protein